MEFNFKWLVVILFPDKNVHENTSTYYKRTEKINYGRVMWMELNCLN
jgi:hypothetical protein